MDNLHNRPEVELGTKSFTTARIKEDLKISEIASFGGEMLENMENIILQSFQFLYLRLYYARKKLPFLR